MKRILKIILKLIILFLILFLKIIYTTHNLYLTIDFNKDYNFLNIFLISNKLELIKKLELTNTNIRLNLPKDIKIKRIKNKGYGLISIKDIKKNDLIYETPIRFFHKNKQIYVITQYGKHRVIKNVHCDTHIGDYIMFDYWDIFLNHDYKHNAYYKKSFKYFKGNIYQSLYAIRDIKKGEEITINYLTLKLFIFNQLINILFL